MVVFTLEHPTHALNIHLTKTEAHKNVSFNQNIRIIIASLHESWSNRLAITIAEQTVRLEARFVRSVILRRGLATWNIYKIRLETPCQMD